MRLINPGESRIDALGRLYGMERGPGESDQDFIVRLRALHFPSDLERQETLRINCDLLEESLR